MVLGLFFSGLTLHFKVVATGLDTVNSLEYNFLLWLMFIYYSFQTMDEMIEIFSTKVKLQKGALGLLFELNYFMGVAVAIYSTVFVYGGRAELPDEYKSMERFIKY